MAINLFPISNSPLISIFILGISYNCVVTLVDRHTSKTNVDISYN